MVLVAIVAGVTWFFYGRAPSLLASGACRGCNVLLVTIDTLRADRVGAFGGSAGLTPNLDHLASEGLRLTRAYSAAPLTLPSHASILTATPPPIHGLRANGLFRLGPALPTLATVLKTAGYRTGAFVGSFVLDARFGLNRGFDEYDDRYGEKHPGDPAEGAERRGEEVIKPALAWITGRGLGLWARGSENAGPRPPSPQPPAPSPQSPAPSPQPLAPSPWFMWVHLYDPHEPYRAPQPYASQHEPYDAEVAYADAMVGQLLSGLPAGALDRTVIMIAADHGESLGDHGERTHGVFAYDVTMRVPWIVWTPGRVRASSDALVRLVDLAPTALDLVGIASPPEFEGRSIVAPRTTVRLKADTTYDNRTAYIEAMDANLTRNWAPLTGLVTRTHKLIDLPVPELYDLTADPKETANLFSREPERARTLSTLLRDMAAGFQARGAAAEKTTLSADARQRLQALGYVATSADRASRVYTDADDPKTLIGPANDLNRALGDFKAGSREQAMTAVRAILQARPGFSTAYGVLASMQRDVGDLTGAITTLEEVVRRGIADQSVMVVLGGYLQETGALDQSAALLEAVVASHGDYADAYNSLGVVYSRLGRHDRAQAAFRHVLAIDPTSATAYENLGVDAAASGDPARAVADLERALELDPDLAGAHNALGAVLLQQGHRAEALEHWRKAVQLNPLLYDALYNLGTVLHSSGRRDEARPYLERFVADAPRARYGPDLARIRRMLNP